MESTGGQAPTFFDGEAAWQPIGGGGGLTYPGINDITHGVEAGGFAAEEAGGSKRTAGEDGTALGAMRQDQSLLGTEEHHVMIARYCDGVDDHRGGDLCAGIRAR